MDIKSVAGYAFITAFASFVAYYGSEEVFLLFLSGICTGMFASLMLYMYIHGKD